MVIERQLVSCCWVGVILRGWVEVVVVLVVVSLTGCKFDSSSLF